MEKARFSIILATKFASECLDLCLKSFFANKTLDIELIIIADNPSWQVVKVLQDRKLKYHLVNNGHYWINLNYGITLTTNDYVGYINDDVVLGPNWDIAIQELLGENNIVGMMNLQDHGGFRFSLDGKTTKVDNFDYNAFIKYCLDNSKNEPMMNYAMPGVFYKPKFLDTGGFTTHADHGYGHDCQVYSRMFYKYGAVCPKTFKSYLWHFGASGNADQLDESIYRGPYTHGHMKCMLCTSFVEGLEYTSKQSWEVLDSGYYICDSCKSKKDFSDPRVFYKEKK